MTLSSTKEYDKYMGQSGDTIYKWYVTGSYLHFEQSFTETTHVKPLLHVMMMQKRADKAFFPQQAGIWLSSTTVKGNFVLICTIRKNNFSIVHGWRMTDDEEMNKN